MSTTKVTDAMRNVTVVDAAKITTGTIPEARITTLTATKLTGTIADARISASSVNAHVDLTAVTKDISLLALQTAINGNLSAYGLTNSWIEQFENSTYIEALTNVDRVTSEYVASAYSDLTLADAGGTSGSWGNANTSDNVATTPTYGTGDDLGMDATSYNYNFISHSSGTDDTTGEAMLAGDCRSSFTGVSNDVGTTTTSTSAEYYEFGLMTAVSVAGTSSLTGINSNGIYIAFGGNGEDIRIIEKSGTGETLLSTYTTSWISSQEISLIRSGSTMYLQIDGVTVYTVDSSNFNSSAALKSVWAFGRGAAARAFNDCAFRYNATSLKGLTTSVNNSTGSFNSTDVVPQDTTNKSSVGLVVLYKDQVGANTLNTDIVAKVRANTGQAYQTLVLAGAGTYSNSLKIAIAPAIAVTAGQALSYEISFANQVLTSKEARIHGVAMTY